MGQYKLLSFDGGGIRGYISISLLAHLEAETGVDVIAHIDGVCGTSTGGLIALGLAVGQTPAQLVSLYRDHAAQIFDPREDHGFGGLEDKLFEKLGFPDPHLLVRTKYTSDGLKATVQPFLKDAPMKDAQLDVAVNTARLWDDGVTPPRWRAVTATSFESEYAGVAMVDLACATSAAPTYFPPHNIPGFGFFADGGLSANNPSLSTFAALKASGRVKHLADMQIVSFGTGLAPSGLSPDTIGDPLEWGIFKWLNPRSKAEKPAVPLMGGMFDLSGSATDDIAQGLFGDQIARVQPILEQPISLDSHTDAAFDAMDAVIEAATKTHQYATARDMIARWVGTS